MRKKVRPMIVAFEGLPKAGKTTTIRAVCDILERKKITFKKIDIASIPLAEDIRRIYKTFSPRSRERILMYWVFRTLQIKSVAASSGVQVIILDRYVWSTFVNDVYGNGIDAKIVNWVLSDAQGPDVTVLLDVDLNILEKRGWSEGSDNIKFVRRIRKGYLKCAKKFKWNVLREHNKSISEIAEQCVDIIVHALGKI